MINSVIYKKMILGDVIMHHHGFSAWGFSPSLSLNIKGHSHLRVKYLANNLGKFGVPNPVTGSQPGTAVKPGVPHP